MAFVVAGVGASLYPVDLIVAKRVKSWCPIAPHRRGKLPEDVAKPSNLEGSRHYAQG
jgi:hypothetical protein